MFLICLILWLSWMHLQHTSSLDLLAKSAASFTHTASSVASGMGRIWRHSDATSTQIAAVERTHYRFPLIPWEMTPRSDSVTVGGPTTKSASPLDKKCAVKRVCAFYAVQQALYTCCIMFLRWDLTWLTSQRSFTHSTTCESSCRVKVHACSQQNRKQPWLFFQSFFCKNSVAKQLLVIISLLALVWNNSWGRPVTAVGKRKKKNKGQKLVLPCTVAHKFHQSTPAEAPAIRPSCSDQRWPKKEELECTYTLIC